MKTKIFTLGINLFLLAFLANSFVLQAQIPEGGTVQDSVYVWDDFQITGESLTETNGSTGEGWTGVWTYSSGTNSGVDVEDGSIIATAGGFRISRTLVNSIPLNASEFYLAFVVNKSETGNFRIAGNRDDGLERYAVGINADGALTANIANANVIGDPGVIENNIPYLVIAKWMYGSGGIMNISVYKAGETLPSEEPAAGAWNFEDTGGASGVSIDYFSIAFTSETIQLFDFKVGDTWSSVMDSSLLIAPTGIKANALTTTSALLTWSDNSFNEEGYKIYLDGTEVGTVGANVEAYEVPGLTEGNTYTFGVSAYSGNNEGTVAEFESIFELDETLPTVTETSPENDATGIDETSDIVIKFSEIMNKVSVEGALTVEPALTNAQYTWDGDTILTISADDLANSTLYTVTIGTGAADPSGNNLEVDYVFNFTTIEQDLTPPTIVETSPADNATDVLVTSNIEIAFSEAMDAASVEGAITVSPELTNIAFTWLSDSLVKISGTEYLAASTEYTVTIGTGASDVKGNGLTAEESVSYMVSASGLLQHDDFSIPNGELTESNGTTGQGWDGAWEYSLQGAPSLSGVVALNEYLTGGTAHITRKVNIPFKIASTDFYMSFLAHRSPDGSFDILGGRFFGGSYQYRCGVGVSETGRLRFRINSGAIETSTQTGIFESGTTYLVVFKHVGQQSQKVKLFKQGEDIVEPGDGDWDFELAQGNTGVSMDYVGVLFGNAAANIDELKVGYTWEDVASTTITDISEFGLLAPGIFIIEANSPVSAEIKWIDNSVGEEGFKIYVNGVEVATVDENVKKYELTNLTEGETYTISINAYKGAEEAASEEISYTFIFDPDYYVDTDIEIAKTPTAPVIDGVVDDVWKENSIKNPIKRFNPLTEEAPEDDADYQATWSAMWDDNNLYFLFEVTDQTLVFNDGSGTAIGQDDGFDLPMAKGPDGEWTMNRLNLIAPEGGDTSLYIHEGMPAVKSAEKAFTFTEDGYIIELSIVLRDFDESIGLVVEGYQFRMDARYNDDDTGGNRDAQYTWTDKNIQGWTWNNINSLGYVTLAESLNITVPTVTETSPADAATNVAVNSDIVITFSLAMNKETVESAIAVEPALTNVQFAWEGDTKVTISADDFDITTDYTVTIGTAALGATGDAMAEEYSFSFRTGYNTGVDQDLIQKLKVYTSHSGSLLHIDHYDGPADIIDITGKYVQHIENTMEPVNISSLKQGVFIIRTEKGAAKFVK